MSVATVRYENLFVIDSSYEAIIEVIEIDKIHKLVTFQAPSTYPQWNTFVLHLREVPNLVREQILGIDRTPVKYFRVKFVFGYTQVEIVEWFH